MMIADYATIARMGVSMLVGKMPRFPVVGSFEVTNRCTLRCKHCYWWEFVDGEELPENDYYEKVKEVKSIYPTILTGVWLGGEPLLRKNLVERCMGLFPFNEVITNGTLPLPDWKSVRFACSVDGTKEFHESQRGLNTYDKIKRNINREDLNVNIICIVTKLNERCLEEFVSEWSKTKVRSMGFGFFTPIRGKSNNNSIWLDFKERDVVLDRLKILKQKYPNFINSSIKLLDCFRSEFCHGITERCRRDHAPFNGMCFDYRMVRKFPCIIGDGADCSKCGCGGAFISEAFKRGDRSFIKEHVKAKLPFLPL